MMTVSSHGEVALWDSQKMEIVQTVRNQQYMQTKTISCTQFFKPTGTLLLATTKVSKWQLQTD